MARVMVVEDDPDIRALVAARLKGRGHAVRQAGSAQEAMGVVTEVGMPELVVLDVGLPVVDGVQLLGMLRAAPGGADLAAVFLSARVEPADIERGRAAGAEYLTKPFVATALLSAVDRLLSARVAVEDGW